MNEASERVPKDWHPEVIICEDTGYFKSNKSQGQHNCWCIKASPNLCTLNLTNAVNVPYACYCPKIYSASLSQTENELSSVAALL